jgi:hypothetical protein
VDFKIPDIVLRVQSHLVILKEDASDDSILIYRVPVSNIARILLARKWNPRIKSRDAFR